MADEGISWGSLCGLGLLVTGAVLAGPTVGTSIAEFAETHFNGDSPLLTAGEWIGEKSTKLASTLATVATDGFGVTGATQDSFTHIVANAQGEGGVWDVATKAGSNVIDWVTGKAGTGVNPAAGVASIAVPAVVAGSWVARLASEKLGTLGR